MRHLSILLVRKEYEWRLLRMNWMMVSVILRTLLRGRREWPWLRGWNAVQRERVEGVIPKRPPRILELYENPKPIAALCMPRTCS